MKKINYLSVILILLVAATRVSAASYDFACITANDLSADSCLIAEAQMSVEVNDAGNSQVEFLFSNTGTDLKAAIADIYIYSAAVFGAYDISGSAGVSFTAGATPGHLPSYSSSTSLIFSADSDSPVAKNALLSGEWLSIVFDLNDGYTYTDVIHLMDMSGDDGMVVGIHAQSLGEANEYSESLITVVPVPAALVLFVSGLLGLLGFSRKKSL